MVRVRRTFAQESNAVPSGLGTAVNFNVGSPPKGQIWLIEAAVFTTGARAGLPDADVPNYLLVIIDKGDPDTWCVAAAEGFRVQGWVNLARPAPVLPADKLIVVGFQRNDSGSPRNLRSLFYVQLLQEQVDDDFSEVLLPADADPAISV